MQINYPHARNNNVPKNLTPEHRMVSAIEKHFAF
jgi:hypothetical protein